MSFIFSVKDTYRQAVEAVSGGKNTVMYDDRKYPSIMVRIPKFYLDEVINEAPHQAHPAFLVNSVEKSEIWISKYQNIVHAERAYSLPGQDPANSLNFNTCRGYCTAKGTGWHLVTNAEWAAIALWCRKAGKMPRGNTSNGASSDATYERGVKATGGGDYRTLTGSGPASWNHDGTPGGIADLCGNVSEWVDGLKLVNGRIYVHPDNNYAVGNVQGSVDGWQDTELYFDNTVAGDNTQTSHEIVADPILSADRTNPMYTGGNTDSEYGYSSVDFADLAAEVGVSVPNLLKYLALYPVDTGDHGGDNIYVRNYGERLPLRGGAWAHGATAGVFHLNFISARSIVSSAVGFRAAFIG